MLQPLESLGHGRPRVSADYGTNGGWRDPLHPLVYSAVVGDPFYDLIVVGAGPGGSNAAAVALGGGLTVAQIDRAVFPRVKPCAGGLTLKACAALRLAYEPWVRSSWGTVEFNLWEGSSNRFTNLHRPVVRMVSRPEFDNALVKQNLSSPGFELHSGERVIEASHEGSFRIRTTRRTLRSAQLVAADGAYSTVNRIFGIARPRATAVAIEVNVPREIVEPATQLHTCFDFGAVERGYGWVFPKDDHWSVGLYTYRRGLKDLKVRLRGYLKAKGLAVPEDFHLQFHAHQVPVGGYRFARTALPLYVVGDAGGYADALTGEGIYHALESGRLAGETAIAARRGARRSPAGRYHRRLWPSVLADTFLTYHAAGQFYQHLHTGTRLLALPPVWRTLIEGYSEGQTMTQSLALGAGHCARTLVHRNLVHRRLTHGA